MILNHLKKKNFKLKYFKAFYNKIKNRLIVNYLKKRYGNRLSLKPARINNYDMFVFVNEGIGRQIFGLKKYEQTDTKFLKKIIQKDWISFDIGANIGYYTLLLARLSSRGQVHVFEPSNLPYCLLNLNISINKLENVSTNMIAFANRNGCENFNITQDSGFSSFKDTKRMEICKIVKVKTKTLDSYVLENNIKKIDFMKMDVEGAEKLVLKGAQKTLRKLKPKLLMIEICPENLTVFREKPSSIINFLAKFNYHPHVLSKGKLTALNSEFNYRSKNIFFVYK